MIISAYSNHVKSICFQQVHWLSVASRICRHSRQVTSTALWQPNQMRQETTANDIFCTNSCSVQLQLGNVSTTGGDCPSSCNPNEFFSADSCPARCRWASPPHPGENPQPMWRLRLISLGTVALSNIPAVSKYDILIMQYGAFLPLTFCSSCILSIKSITETKSQLLRYMGCFQTHFGIHNLDAARGFRFSV